MAPGSPFWSSLRDLFGGSSSRRRRSRGKRPAQSFIAQFDGGDGAVGRLAPAPLGGFDALEVRVMLAVTTAAESDFGFNAATGTITSYSGSGGDIAIPATIGGVTVTGIADYAFYDKAALTSLVIPATVKTIGNDVFEECVNLTTIALPAGLTRIGDYAFWNCRSLTSLALPDDLTTIGEQAFYNCAALKTLAIPASVASIGNFAFQDCAGLTAFDVAAGNASYKSIDGLLFTKDGATLVQCPQAKTGTVSLPAGLKTIGAAALENCDGLTGVAIPAGVTTIDAGAFYGCDGLTILAIPASVTSIGAQAFSVCNALTTLTVEAGNPAYKTVGSLLLTANGQTVVACAGGTTGAVAIPAGVTTIGDYALKGCGGLTVLTFPATLTRIGRGGFDGCIGLKSLVIPATVTFLDALAFGGCRGLTSLVFLGNAPGCGSFPFDRVTATITYLTGTTGWQNPFNGLTTVGVAAVDYRSGDFAYSISRDAVTITEYTGSAAAVTIPDTIFGLPVKGIGNSAFAGNTGLVSLVIPAGITSIGANAFKGCTGLASLYFLGNAPATVGGDAFSGVTATIYYLPATTGWSSPFNGLKAVAINAAPTAVSLSPASASVAENTSTSARLKVADVVVTDDGVGTNATTLSGADAARFEVDAGVLYLKAGTLLDFETKPSYSVTVSVADASVVGSTSVTATFTLTVTNVNEAPTAVALVNTVASLPENTSTAARLKMADIIVTDDALGTIAITLSGADAASFETVGTVLYLKAGVALDFEIKPTYSVTVNAADPALPGSAPASAAFTLAVTNVNEAPTGISLSPSTIPENRPAGTTVGTFLAADPDAGGTFTYALVAGAGATDNASFAILGAVLRTTTSFNYEVKNSYSIRVQAIDQGGLVTEKVFTVGVSDVVEPFRAEFVRMPEGRAYKAGDVLRFTVVLSRPATVVGKPTIDIVAGAGAKSAVYVSGSGTNNVVFQYVVAGTANAASVVLGSSIRLPTAATTIRDAAKTNLPLAIPGGRVQGASFDTIAPAVTAVAAPAAKTYRPGDVVRFTVTFSENVTVRGTPFIQLTLAGQVGRRATYVSGSGTRTAVFEYRVQAGDTAPRGPTMATTIGLAGGAITDAAGNPAVLAIKPPVLTGVVIAPVR